MIYKYYFVTFFFIDNEKEKMGHLGRLLRLEKSVHN